MYSTRNKKHVTRKVASMCVQYPRYLRNSSIRTFISEPTLSRYSVTDMLAILLDWYYVERSKLASMCTVGSLMKNTMFASVCR